MSNFPNPKFNLEERTAIFGEQTIILAKQIPHNSTNSSIISQFVKSGTSMGANYCEADAAESKKDFEHKMGICKKEAKETCYWLRIIASACPELKDQARKLWKEAHELLLIFSKIIQNSRNNKKQN